MKPEISLEHFWDRPLPELLHLLQTAPDQPLVDATQDRSSKPGRTSQPIATTARPNICFPASLIASSKIQCFFGQFSAFAIADLFHGELTSANAAAPTGRGRWSDLWHMLSGGMSDSNQFATTLRTLSLDHVSNRKGFV